MIELDKLVIDFKEPIYDFIIKNKVDKTFKYVNKEHISFDHVYDDWEGNNYIEFSLGPTFLNSVWMINIPALYCVENKVESFLISKKNNSKYLYRK